jgi:hypothetical protein
MTEEQVFKQTGDTYLRLIHPAGPDNHYRSFLAPLREFTRTVPSDVVSSLICGASWRERLLGLWVGMAQGPEPFVEPMLGSFRRVTGYSITPTCAALAVLARHGRFDIGRLQSLEIDASAFDGDLGWAIKQAERYARGEVVGVDERCRNSGQSFLHQVEMYEWIIGGQQDAAGDNRPAGQPSDLWNMNIIFPAKGTLPASVPELTRSNRSIIYAQMNTVLQKMVRQRIAIAAVIFLLVFLGLNAAFFLAAPDELTIKTQTSRSGAAVEIHGGPSVEALMSSPMVLIVVMFTAILIIGWLIFSAKAASRLKRDTRLSSEES